MECIKCGKPVPKGELFCPACSQNLTEEALRGTSAERYPAAEGRMQTPRLAAKAAPAPTAEKKTVGAKSRSRAPFIVVCVLLVLCLGILVWQQTDIQLEKNRLRVRAEDMDALEWELEQLKTQTDQLTVQLETAQQTIAAKELALQEVESALSGSESTMSQTQYEMATQKLELERAKSELTTLQAELEAAEEQLAEAQAQLETARTDREKAAFMDDHVVFVEDNRTGLYHTYDCAAFPKQKFWAYSRKLAETNGFKPCPTCGGRP